MAPLSVLGFKTANGVSEALDKIQSLQNRQVIKAIDAAIVTRAGGRKDPKPNSWSAWWVSEP